MEIQTGTTQQQVKRTIQTGKYKWGNTIRNNTKLKNTKRGVQVEQVQIGKYNSGNTNRKILLGKYKSEDRIRQIQLGRYKATKYKSESTSRKI